MRTISALILSVVVLTGAGLTPAFAQMVEPVVVTTDKDSYMEGDVVMISGQVLQRHSGGLALVVIAPNGNVVAVAQPAIGPGNTFSYNLVTGGQMTQEGIYTIEASYSIRGEPRMGIATFMYTPLDTPGVLVDGTEFEPNFTISGGMVVAMYTNPDANTLIVDIDARDDGTLSITLPRMLIDSKMADGTDDSFFVLVDGEEVDYDETAATEDSRTLVIDFSVGTERIEIIGTWAAVPEFGTIAALILAVAIVSIVAVSARSRLSLVPRF